MSPPTAHITQVQSYNQVQSLSLFGGGGDYVPLPPASHLMQVQSGTVIEFIWGRGEIMSPLILHLGLFYLSRLASDFSYEYFL